MREFILKQKKSVSVINDIPVRIVEPLDKLWEKIGFSEDEVQVRLL